MRREGKRKTGARALSRFTVLLLALSLLCAGCGQKRQPEEIDPRSSREIIGELVADYGRYGAEADEQTETLLRELRMADPDAGERWTEIMALWRAAGAEGGINYDVLPDGLPDTDELAIVVLGFQLNSDGSMRSELVERLKVARKSAEKYPNALVVCTGGGTAAGNAAATEAGEMAAWLIENGIGSERVIVEDRSLTTVQNAVFTYDILTAQYPQVRQLAIVSSDYHIGTGTLLFGAEAILRADTAGGEKLTVVSNAAWKAPAGSLSSAFQAAALLELSGDKDRTFGADDGLRGLPTDREEQQSA